MSDVTFVEVSEHKGHRLTVEADDVTANIYCDDCGEILVTRHADARPAANRDGE